MFTPIHSPLQTWSIPPTRQPRPVHTRLIHTRLVHTRLVHTESLTDVVVGGTEHQWRVAVRVVAVDVCPGVEQRPHAGRLAEAGGPQQRRVQVALLQAAVGASERPCQQSHVVARDGVERDAAGTERERGEVVRNTGPGTGTGTR